MLLPQADHFNICTLILINIEFVAAGAAADNIDILPTALTVGYKEAAPTGH